MRGTLGNQNPTALHPAELLLTNAQPAVPGTLSATQSGLPACLPAQPQTALGEGAKPEKPVQKPTSSATACTLKGCTTRRKPKTCWHEVPGISGTVPGIGNLGSIENSGVELALSWRDRIERLEPQHRNEPCHHQEQGTEPRAGRLLHHSRRQAAELHNGRIPHRLLLRLQGGRRLPDPGEIEHSPKNTLATVTPGDLKFRDVNGDGEITTADRTMIGNPTPDVTYGFTLGLGYKNWELAVDMMGQGGNQIYRTWDNYNWSQFNLWSNAWTAGTVNGPATPSRC